MRAVVRNGRGARGFTLIELLMAVALAAILMAFASPGLSSMVQSWRLRGATESLSMGLQTARSEAIRRNARVQLELVDGSWTVRPTPAAGGTAEAPIDSRSLQESGGAAVVAIVPATQTVIFNNRGAVEGGAPQRFSVTAPNGKCTADGGGVRCLDIRVAAGGQIRTCDPALKSTTDPRYCTS